MSSKTKIVVLRMKELIYTGIFVALGIILILLLVFMFAPKDSKPDTTNTSDKYVPGVYSSSIMLNGNAVDIAVTVDKDSIASIQMVNVSQPLITSQSRLLLLSPLIILYIRRKINILLW